MTFTLQTTFFDTNKKFFDQKTQKAELLRKNELKVKCSKKCRLFI